MFIYISKKISIPHQVKLKCISWNQDERWIACGGENCLLKVLKLETSVGPAARLQGIAASSNLSMNQTLEGHSGAVICVTWNPMHSKLTTSDETGLIIMWMLKKGVWYEETINNRNKSVAIDMKWTADGNKIAIIYEDGAIIVGSIDGNRLWGEELNTQLKFVEWSPDSRFLLLVTSDAQVWIYNAGGNKVRSLILVGQDPSSLSSTAARITGIHWFCSDSSTDNIPAAIAPAAASVLPGTLCIAFDNGKIQMSRGLDDASSETFDSGLSSISYCRWATKGNVLAIVGKIITSSKPANMVKFFDGYGKFIRSIRIPGENIAAVSWEGGDLRLCMAVDSFIYFANIRPAYTWAYFSDTVVFAYPTSEHNRQTNVVFWDLLLLEAHMTSVSNLQYIAAAGDLCAIVLCEKSSTSAPVAAADQDESAVSKAGALNDVYSIQLRNSIGAVVDTKVLPFVPKYLSMSATHVIVANDRTVYAWQFHSQVARTDLAKELISSIDAHQSKVRMFDIANTSFTTAQSPETFQIISENFADPVVSTTISDKFLVVGRKSGAITRFNLPHLTPENTYTVQDREPSRMMLNCSSSKLGLVDTNGLFSILDLEARVTEADAASNGGNHNILGPDFGKKLSVERKDVWDMRWSENDPDMIVIMEKTKMIVFNGETAEEPVVSSAYLCRFKDLEVRVVALDSLVMIPGNISRDYVMDIKTGNRREGRDVNTTEGPQQGGTDKGGTTVEDKAEASGNPGKVDEAEATSRLMAKALQQGSMQWKRSKFSLLGQGRAGKTAFANAIAGRDFEETASTVGINQLTCDVKQVRANAGGADGAGEDEQQWGECTRKGEREYETAVAQVVARNKRLAQQQQEDAAADAQQRSGDIRAYMRTLAEAVVAVDRDEGGAAADIEKHAGGAAEEGNGAAELGLEAAREGHSDAGGRSEPLAGSRTEGIPVLTAPSLRPAEPAALMRAPQSTQQREPDPAEPESVSELDEEMVMTMLATMKDEDSGLLISLFDFGGQSVFDVIHHLFLTRNGVYALVFNMEWLVNDGPEKDKALRFMRNWLCAIAVHTFNKTTQMTAPIVIVGTRLDTVTSPAAHEKISTVLHEHFSDNLAWRSVVGNEEGRDSNGRAFQWFFPVDNKLGKKGGGMKRLMSVVHGVINSAEYTHKEVPLTWFKVIDQMSDTKKDFLPLSEVVALGRRSEVSPEEVPFLLAFLHDMGHLMWIDEPGLRDVAVLDPVSYLVVPATIIICKLVPDHDDTTHHFMAVHRECERMHKREWTLLKNDGVLHVSLLPILWKDYLSHKDVLVQLMVKFGLLVPLRAVSDRKSTETENASSAAPRVVQYLVPTLLSPAPVSDPAVLEWSDVPFCSCHLVFTLVEELEQSTVVTVSDLKSCGFLPGGMFERIVGKALSWSQDTAKGSGVNLQCVLLYKDMAVMAFGGQRFRLVNCASIHCVRVDIEGSNPLGIQQKLQDFVGKIIEECMKSLRCFPAVLYSNSARDQEDVKEHGDLLRKQLLSSELLIPLQQLRGACKGESMLAWRGGRSLMTTADIKSKYGSWLQLYERRERYDVFISYRWGQHDSVFVEKTFDMFTNFSVAAEMRAVEVFLDRKRLQDGRLFRLDFAAALTHSLIALPVVSVDAVRRMVDHNPDAVDNVLLEWIMILQCYQAGRLLKVFPVLFGSRVSGLQAPQGQQVDPASAVAAAACTTEPVVTDFFAETTKDLLPKLAPTATLAQAAELLTANGVIPSEGMQKYTVHSVVHELLLFLLCKASDFAPSDLVENFAQKAVRLLSDCGAEALDAVVGKLPAVESSKEDPAPATPATPVVAQVTPSTASGAARSLKELSVDEVQALLGRCGFEKAMPAFLSNKVTGKRLWFCEEYGELLGEEFGLTSKPLARELMELIEEWRAKGVSNCIV